MRPRRRKSRGIQAIAGAITAAASTIVVAAPEIVPYLPDRYVRPFAIVTGIAGAIVAGLSQPPRSYPSRRTDSLPQLDNSGEYRGEL